MQAWIIIASLAENTKVIEKIDILRFTLRIYMKKADDTRQTRTENAYDGMSTRVSFILQYSQSFGYAGQVDGYGANKPNLRGYCGKLP